MRIGIGIDTGGTCTDAVAYDYDERKVLASGKSLTTREDLSIGISKALDTLPQDYIRDASLVCLSTTLATNACVENKGGRAKLVIFGLTDELMERLKVESNYGIKHGYVRCVDTHSSADGMVIDEPNWEELFKSYDAWLSDVDYMAAAELYGPTTGAPCEKKFKALLNEKYGLSCICANELTDKIDVISRGATALLNARLLPIVQNFISVAAEGFAKRGCKAPIMVVRSDGSLMSTEATALKPVETILSGPAASILAGKALGKEDNYLVVDMGGTTTDVSIVENGQTRNVERGIHIGGWRTSVSGVFVDTFALGGDTNIRFVKDQLELEQRRCIPLCVASSRWPEVKPMLKALYDAGYSSRFQLQELLCLIHEPENTERYNEYELALLEKLKDGPKTLHYLKENGIDLYGLDTERLEAEGVIIRAGLTPTDFMHIKGDYTEFDGEASELAVRYLLKSSWRDVTDENVMAMADTAYELVECRMYTNLVRIMLSQDHKKRFDDGLDANMDYVVKAAWNNFRNGNKPLLNLGFRTDMALVGMGAPTHVFLPKVAEALGAKCVLPEFAEVGNAVGALIADLVVNYSITITQWNTDGITYIVHAPGGSVKYKDIEEAVKFAGEQAAEEAKKEARLRGAVGELSAVITATGNRHDNFSAPSMVYGGIVTARVSFTLEK